MNRWSRAAFSGIVLLLISAQSQAQQTQSPIQNAEVAYPNSSEGLQKLLQNTVEALKSKDTTKAAELLNTLMVPEGSTWFQDEFGPAFGPRLAAVYEKTKPEMEREMVSVFKGNADRGWTKPKIFRYSDAATADSPTDGFLNCMEDVVALYRTAFDGDRIGSQMGPRPDDPKRMRIVAGDLPGYFVYAKDGFRFIPQDILLLLPKERPIRIQLGMEVMRSKIMNNPGGRIPMDALQEVIKQHLDGKVVIHFVVDTSGKINEIHAAEGSPALSDPFLQQVKQWTFEPTTLDGEPVEVEVNFETGFMLNGHF